MERTASLLSLSSRSSSHSSSTRNHEPLLPYSENVTDKPFIRARSLLGSCLYRRVLIWTVLSLAVVSVFLFKAGDASADVVSTRLSATKPAPTLGTPTPQTTNNGNTEEEDGGTVLVIVSPESQKNKGKETKENEKTASTGIEDELSAEADEEQRKKTEEDLKKMPWLRFPHLNGYYHGLKTLVNKSNHIAEYPNPHRQAPVSQPPLNKEIPRPRPYNPYSSDSSIRTCYLDRDNKIPAPSLYAYEGVPQHIPDPALGSYNLLGIRDDVCFDRFGRYGPYGLGYRMAEGGSGMGLDTEDSGSQEVWAESGQINYGQIDWGDVQERCSAANKHRFVEPDPDTEELKPSEGKKTRIAVMIRLYTGFKWTQLAVLNFRALITELSLKSGGEYAVHFLLHVRDDDVPIWADEVTVQRVLDSNMPPEFHGLVTLWSEAQMKLFYPGKFDEPLSNPSHGDVHGVYRSAHLPLQVFALHHPEYEHFWNWEMDMRFLGNYYELFDRIGRWADKQPRALLWERNARYYVPSYHGSWENFTVSVQQDTIHSKKPTIFGPVDFEGKKKLRLEQNGGQVLPESCDKGRDMALCGVGEAADIITLNPIFDVNGSGWVFSNDVTGYVKSPSPPRRCAIITASRLSRRLLIAMHEEVWRYHHTMFSEMFPPTVAFHHGFKAVYAPHPVFLERAWDPQGSSIDNAFNGGQDHSTSGSGSPFHLYNEHNHKGTSWYYNSEFAGLLWRRWLGYAQMDGRGRFGGTPGGGRLRGGKKEEDTENSSGRMCLRSMLVHPIKYESPAEKP
ncbi:hypothetical protein PT974_11576 [Cladobotryum mycophilum]|uniref:Major facilitator superfamily transporter n=1 Tax=Cladobotryum mycophilum TaxID=491253 RepID=A0ABR0S5L7_9HYPO